MYKYDKPWYCFGKVKKIYYSELLIWIIEFTNNDCTLDNFYYSNDKNAYLKAKEASIVLRDVYSDCLIFENIQF